eukprot:m51a1_g11788 hypothetical protein (762) ;mRNA; r:300874-303437
MASAGPYKRAGSWPEYARQKYRKLQDQDTVIAAAAAAGGDAPAPPALFSGVSVWVTGATHPTALELRDIVVAHGGRYEHFFTRERVTHVVAECLPDSKAASLAPQPGRRPLRVVRPEWLVRCVEAGSRLPEEPFLLLSAPAQAAQAPAALPRCTDPGFVAHYFGASRLHHLSAWKAQFQDELARFVADMQLGMPESERAAAPEGVERVLLHVDMDCFFASVSRRSRPELDGRPVVVCHGGVSGTSSEIACASYEARAAGVRNGMALGRARELCRDVEVLPYDYAEYERVSRAMYASLLEQTPAVMALSCDEALADVTGRRDGLQAAQEIRENVRRNTGCPASVGVGPSPMLAKLACKRAKPDGVFRVLPGEAGDFVGALEVGQLPGIGRVAAAKAEQTFGATLCSDLVRVPLRRLQDAYGDNAGRRLYEMVRGIDSSVPSMIANRQTVSVNVTWGIRFNTDEEVKRFLGELAEELCRRLREAGSVGSRLTLKWKRRTPGAPPPGKYLGHGMADDFNRRADLASPSNDPAVIARVAVEQYALARENPRELRGLGLAMTKLRKTQEQQKQTTVARRRSKDIAELVQQIAAVGDKPPQQPQETGLEQAQEHEHDEEDCQASLLQCSQAVFCRQREPARREGSGAAEAIVIEDSQPVATARPPLFAPDCVEDVERALAGWLRATETPKMIHVEVVVQFVRQLVEEGDLESTVRVLQVFRRVASSPGGSAWREAFDFTLEWSNQFVGLKYKGVLSVPYIAAAANGQ